MLRNSSGEICWYFFKNESGDGVLALADDFPQNLLASTLGCILTFALASTTAAAQVRCPSMLSGQKVFEQANLRPWQVSPSQLEALAEFSNSHSLDKAWAEAKSDLSRYLLDRLEVGATVGLYQIQTRTAATLLWASAARDSSILHELGELYMLAFPYAKQRDAIGYYYVHHSGTLSKPRRITIVEQPAGMRAWLNNLKEQAVKPEPMLDSAQFLYGVSRLLRALVESDVSDTVFESEAWRLLNDHLMRWVFSDSVSVGSFQRTGWGCGYGSFNHSAVIDNLLERRYGSYSLPGNLLRKTPSYCNAVTDLDLFLIAIAGEMLLTQQLNGKRFPVSVSQQNRLRDYVERGLTLIESRLSSAKIEIRNNLPLAGLILDRGEWDDHPDMRYSGDVESVFPGSTHIGESPIRQPKPAMGVGWDLSHSRRFVLLGDTVTALSNAKTVKSPLTKQQIQAWARQTILGTWNGDLDVPLFSNYVDGSNGWFRINYSDRPDFGIAPFGFSDDVVVAGFGYWGRYDDYISDVILARAAADLVNSNDLEQAESWFRAEWLASVLLASCS